MMRLFIALPLEKTVEDYLSRLILQLKQKGGAVKWVAPQNIHLTVRFLGDTDEKIIDPLKHELDGVVARHRNISTALDRLGAFPNLKRPRVIWIGLGEHLDAMRELAADTEQAVRSLGFEPETKSFRPHLTLGRVRDARDVGQLVDYIGLCKVEKTGFMLDRLVLFKSTLTPRGPIYDRLHEAMLTG